MESGRESQKVRIPGLFSRQGMPLAGHGMEADRIVNGLMVKFHTFIAYYFIFHRQYPWYET